jgi:TonB family protein
MAWRKSTAIVCAGALLAAGVTHAAQRLLRLPPEAAGAAAGRPATVCGEAIDLGCDGPDRAAALTLVTPPGAPRFTIHVSEAERAASGLAAADQRQPRPVCVTGTVQQSQSGYRMVVSRRGQIVFEREPAVSVDRIQRTCDAAVTAPRVIEDPKPQYTAAALRRRVEGRVLLQAVVGLDGRTRDVLVLESLDPDLDDAARKALAAWRFRPGRVEGTPVPLIITSEMAFALGPATASAPPRPPVYAEWPGVCVREAGRILGTDARAIGPNTPTPKKVYDKAPQYPALPPGSRVGPGTTWMGEALITRDGTVVRVWPIREIMMTPPFPAFNDAIADAILQWRFEPTRVDDISTPLCMFVTMSINWP